MAAYQLSTACIAVISRRFLNTVPPGRFQVTDSSCDASGEYTTGESDGDESASSASEDLTCSMVTCHELATPTAAGGSLLGSPQAAGAGLDTTVTPKVRGWEGDVVYGIQSCVLSLFIG